MSELKVTARGERTRCPLCHDAPDGELLACGACGAAYHVECPDPKRSPAVCVVLGCQGTLAPAGAVPTARTADAEPTGLGAPRRDPPSRDRRPMAYATLVLALLVGAASLLVTPTEAGLPGYAVSALLFASAWVMFPESPARPRHASVVVSARASSPRRVGDEPIGTPVGEAPPARPPSTAFPAMFDVARVDALPPPDAEAVRRRQGARGVGNPKGLGKTV